MNMKRLLFLSLVILINASTLFSQDDGGMLCSEEDEKPLWIIRFEVLDEATHYPVARAKIKITDDSTGRSMSWKADEEGIAVLVVADVRCVPASGTIETPVSI